MVQKGQSLMYQSRENGTLGTVPDVPKTVDDFDDLLKVMNTLELTEFQYLVSEDEWTVSIR